MGIALDTTIEYDFPQKERNKLPRLRGGRDYNSVGLSGQTTIIKVEAREYNLPVDSLFRRGPLNYSDYETGYEPVILGPSGIKAAADQLGYRLIGIYMFHLPTTSEGNLKIPVELYPLKKIFEESAGIITGCTGKLKENWLITLALGRDIVHLPGEANNSFIHCDYMLSKTEDGVGRKTPAAGLPPQIGVLAASFVGTRFYPTISFADIARFQKNEYCLQQIPILDDLARGAPFIQAPAEHYSLFSDLHVHEAPQLEPKDVPFEDQFAWAEYENEGAKQPLRTGMATIRDTFHLHCERR